MELTQCHNIVINTPGYIQNFGYLLGINTQNLSIAFYSQNLADIFGFNSNIINQSLNSINCFNSIAEHPLYREAITGHSDKVKNSGRITLNHQEYHIVVYTYDHFLYIELEQVILADNAEQKALKNVKNLISTKDGNQIWNTLVKDIANITGYERVMIYKFNADATGRVIAEEKNTDLESFLNVHYPESDIPKQARQLYLKNYKRIISDVESQPVPIISAIPDIDLSLSGIRAISPVHLQYLKNGRIASSFSISIIINNELWGMVTCHHSTARHIDLDGRILSEIATFIAANSYSSYKASLALSYDKQLSKSCFELKLQLLSKNNFKDSIFERSALIHMLSETDGFAALIDGQIISIGDTPDNKLISSIAHWLQSQSHKGFYFNHSFYNEFSTELGLDKNCCGIASCFLNEAQGDLMIWFRREYKDHINWAGRPEKEIAMLNFYKEEKLTYSPRQSFAIYCEEVINKSRPWRKKDIQRLQKIKEVVDQTAQEFLYKTERANKDLNFLNEELKRVNEELDSYSHTISHDLATPLTVMKLNMQLMAKYNTDQPTIDKIHNVLNEIDNMSEMMNNVLRLSRLKHSEYNFQSIDPADIINKVCLDSKLTYNEDVEIHIGSIYPVIGEKSLIQQVFQNVITNAVKYSSQKETPQVSIRSAVEGDWIIYEIQDNGIGIPYESKHDVFKVFNRMTNSKSFFGNGVGLSIVDNIMKKLGGSVDFESVVDSGTTFYLKFPGS